MGNPFDKAPAAGTVIDAPAPDAVKPVVDAPVSDSQIPAADKPVADKPVVDKPPEGDGTLLGEEPKSSEEIAKLAAEADAKAKAEADAKAEALKNETPEQKAAREKLEAEAQAKAKLVPDKYTLKAPEGMKVDEAFLNDKLAPVLKTYGVTQEAFQKIIDVYAPHLQEQQKQGIALQQTEAIKAWKDNVKAWGEETKAFFGPKLNEEMAYAAKAINKFSSDPKALRELLNDKPGTTGTGLGNNKLLVEFMIKAGKLLGEDTFPKGNPPPGEKDTSDEAKAKRLFPNNP